MHTRLLDVIRYKTNGSQKAFADFLGWSPAYLSKLLRGDSFGLQPTLTILRKIPEIDARWLLLGDGDMLTAQKVTDLQRATLSQVQKILDLERYIAVMTPDQLKRYENALTSNTAPDFTPEEITKMERIADTRAEELDRRFADALAKSQR